MRERILAATGKAFSRAGYDAVGIREIATAADTDPAIVMRLFGSKLALFTQLAERAFGSEAVFDGPLDTMGLRLAGHLMLPIGDDKEDADDLQLLLRSATSLVAAPVLSAALQKGLIGPLAARIGTQDGAARAALVVAQVLGLAILRVSLGAAPLEQVDTVRIVDLYGRAIQLCIDGADEL